MPAKTTRVRLSAGQKLALYSHCNQHPELALRALAAWAGSAFKLRENPLPAAVLMLLKHPVTEDDARSNPTRKANQPVYCLSLEKAFVRWIECCEQLKMPVVTWLRKMVFSDGWIQKLQERHNLKLRRAHGKAVSARVVDVEEGRATLQLITRKYRHHDIFNTNESAYFYCTASPPSASRSSATGRKNTKKRL